MNEYHLIASSAHLELASGNKTLGKVSLGSYFCRLLTKDRYFNRELSMPKLDTAGNRTEVSFTANTRKGLILGARFEFSLEKNCIFRFYSGNTLIYESDISNHDEFKHRKPGDEISIKCRLSIN